jgi:hypothetical protein
MIPFTFPNFAHLVRNLGIKPQKLLTLSSISGYNSWLGSADYYVHPLAINLEKSSLIPVVESITRVQWILPLEKFGTLLETQERSQSRLDSRLFMGILVSTS